MTHVFISYSHQDKAYARQLADFLIQSGFDVWIDDRIDYGDSWWDEIVKAIETCGAFIVIMTPDSEQSKWVRREYLYADKLEKPHFPLLLEGRCFPIYVGTQYVNVVQDKLPNSEFIGKLSNVVLQHNHKGHDLTPIEPSSKPVKDALSSSLVTSNDDNWEDSFVSYEEAVKAEWDSLYERALIPVTSNKSWKPVIRTFNGVEMCLVPAGSFMMGSNNIEIAAAMEMYRNDTGEDIEYEWFTSEQPQHLQIFDYPFWIDRFPITNAHYTYFLKETGYKQKPEYYYDFDAPDQPCVGITWFDAVAYCEWRSSLIPFQGQEYLGEVRLPSEAEWEYAARGPSNWIFPWGNKFVGAYAVYYRSSDKKTASLLLRNISSSASWVGALHLSGNVWEWCNNLYSPYPMSPNSEPHTIKSHMRSIRGGSWDNSIIDKLRSAYRNRKHPNYKSNSLSFRCVRDFHASDLNP